MHYTVTHGFYAHVYLQDIVICDSELAYAHYEEAGGTQLSTGTSVRHPGGTTCSGVEARAIWRAM